MTDDVAQEQHARELQSLRTRLELMQEKLRETLQNLDELWAENLALKKSLKGRGDAG